MTETTRADLDENDLELLRSIEADFDVSLGTLSDELGLSKSAIHYRLNKLREKGVIEGVTANLDPVALGLDMVAITEVSVTHEQGYSEGIGTELATLDWVEQVYYTMGDVDFVVVSRVQNRAQMNDVIEEMVSIDGVNETSSRFVMSELKSNPRTLTNVSTEFDAAFLDD